jgi:hypothetical protein
VKVFDFGRSTFEEGTYKFKKQWGAEPQLLRWQRFDMNNVPIKSLNDSAPMAGGAREIAEKLWRKLPLNLTIKIGALTRPYISL